MLFFALVEDGGQTRVDITTELNLTGSVAQYGRASGLIDAIAGQIISDFATHLEAEIGSDAGAPAGTTGDATATEPVSQPAAEAASSDNSISVISLFFRAIWAMIRGKR